MNIRIKIPDEYIGKNGKYIHWEMLDNHYIIVDNLDGVIKRLGVKTLFSKKYKSLYIFDDNYNVVLTTTRMTQLIKKQEELGSVPAGNIEIFFNKNVAFLNEAKHSRIIHFKYKNGESLFDKGVAVDVVSHYIKKDRSNINRRYYSINCNVCGGKNITVSANIFENKIYCPCCSNDVVITGVNDIATTHPEYLCYFLNIDDAKNNHISSNNKVDFICPNCKRIFRQREIRNVFKNRHILNCSCNDNISYPEKFVNSMLKQLFDTNQFIWQLTKNNYKWVGNYKYDFYIPQFNCIVETHGIQHYQPDNGFYYPPNKDMEKKALAINHGITVYIELDCRRSNINWIKDSVMNSDLPSLFNFTENDIDWIKCDVEATHNIVKDVCNYYKSNVDETVDSLAQKFGIKKDSVRIYLKRGTKLGWCNYQSKSVRELINNHKIKFLIEMFVGDYIATFATTKEAIQYINDNYSLTVSQKAILNGLVKGILVKGMFIFKPYSIACYSDYLNYQRLEAA